MLTEQIVFSRIALLFIIVPLIELYLLFELGSSIGAAPVIAWSIFSGVAGIALLRRQGSLMISSWKARFVAGESPDQGLLHCALFFIGALLLAIPGLLSDLTGLFLLIAPVRRKLTAFMHKNIGTKSNARSNFPIQHSAIVFQEHDRSTQSASAWSVLDLSSSKSCGPQRSAPPIIDAEIISDSSVQENRSHGSTNDS